MSNQENQTSNNSSEADQNSAFGGSLDNAVLWVVKEENIQLFKYAQSQLAKYSDSKPESVTRILELVGLDMKVKNCPDIFKAKSSKHDVIAVLANEKYCVIRNVEEDYVEVVDYYHNSTIKVPIGEFEEAYFGKIIVISNVKGSDANELKASNHWFWNVVKNYRGFYTNVLIAALVINIFGLIIPLFAMNVYDRVIPNHSTETLWALSSGVLIIILFDFALKMLRAFFVESTSKTIDLKLSNLLFAKSLHLFMKDQIEPVGVRAARIRDFESIRDFLSSITLVGLIDFPFLIITLIVIYYIGGVLVFVPMIVLVVAIAIAVFLNSSLDKYTKRSIEGSSYKSSLLFETLLNIETVKNFCMQPLMMDRWEEGTKGVSKAVSKVRFLSTFIVNATSSLGFVSGVVLVIIGTHLIWNSSLTVGGLIACSILSGRVLAPVAQITTIITRYQQFKCSLDSLDNMMLLDDERKGIKQFYSLGNIGKDIEFHEVSFGYPGQSNKLFDKVSFTVKEGEKVAILGNSGSGKSSLLKLMTGLYAPDGGIVSISGANVMQIDPYILRSNIGYVEQNSRLFRGTLWSNITAKNPKAKEEDIIKAVEISGVGSFARKHPDGFNMKIEESGVGLSGGQIQSVVVARALLSNPNIILLDEPTNFMDNNLENNFVSGLKEFLVGKTMIVITHKRSLLDLVDRIIVVDDGKIVADNKKDVILSKLFR